MGTLFFGWVSHYSILLKNRDAHRENLRSRSHTRAGSLRPRRQPEDPPATWERLPYGRPPRCPQISISNAYLSFWRTADRLLIQKALLVYQISNLLSRVGDIWKKSQRTRDRSLRRRTVRPQGKRCVLRYRPECGELADVIQDHFGVSESGVAQCRQAMVDGI